MEPPFWSLDFVEVRIEWRDSRHGGLLAIVD